MEAHNLGNDESECLNNTRKTFFTFHSMSISLHPSINTSNVIVLVMGTIRVVQLRDKIKPFSSDSDRGKDPQLVLEDLVRGESFCLNS